MERCGMYYTAVPGDTNESIVKTYWIRHWDDIYYHPLNDALREHYAETDRIRPGERFWLPSPVILTINSGTSQTIQQRIWRFFFNSHMHIQSNNCCPLPLQWGLVTKAVLGTPVVNLLITQRTYKNRRQLVNTARGPVGRFATGRLGKIGALSTNLVAGVYFGDLKDADMDEEAVWIVMKEEAFDALQEKLGKDKALEKAGKEANLETLAAESAESFSDSFLKPATYYYRESPFTLFSCALLMDMSMAHYWGQWHIPVTLDWGTEAVYLNDWCAVYREVYLLEEARRTLTFRHARIERDIAEPHGHAGSGYRHLFAKSTRDTDFSVRKALEQYRTVQNDSRSSLDTTHLVFEDRFAHEDYCKKEFVHLVDVIPGGWDPEEETPNELKWFEDYKLQQRLSEGAAVTHPLELLLFYHYDPRRHCETGDLASYAAEKAQAIVEKHAFYRYRQPDNPYNPTPPLLVPDEKMNGLIFWNETLKKTLVKNRDAFDSLHQVNRERGIYWGVKIYPRLGYDPADFGRYPQLRALYRTCIEKEIPLLTHSSRGGMAGADYYCYAKYNKPPSGMSANEQARRAALDADPGSLDHAESWFADSFAAPANWENVLNMEEFKTLRFCFAHFGGYDVWCQVGDFEDIERLYPTNPGILPKGEAVESDAPPPEQAAEKERMRATLYYAWIRKIAELIEKKPNVYADTAYFHLKEDLKVRNIELKDTPISESVLKSKSTVDVKKLFAKNIVYLLTKFPNLKDRLLIGTDWYMLEQEKEKGIGEILINQFEVMRMVSAKVGYDAWHQFAVINPLRYLGLGKVEKGKLVVDRERLGGYGEAMLKRQYDDLWIKKSSIKVNFRQVEYEISMFLHRIEMSSEIPLSRDLINDKNELLINQNNQNGNL